MPGGTRLESRYRGKHTLGEQPHLWRLVAGYWGTSKLIASVPRVQSAV